MTTATSAPPGHVGNLTAAQETKLREMWIYLFSAAASVLSAVFGVTIKEASPDRLIEAIDQLDNPTVESLLAVLQGKTPEDGEAKANGTTENGTAEEGTEEKGTEVNGTAENGTEENGTAENGTEENGTAENGTEERSKDEKAVDKLEALINKESEQNLLAEMATRDASKADYSALYAHLRKMHVSENEIRNIQRVLSKMTPHEMCFSIIKMVKQENPDSLLLRFLRARKWDVMKAFTMMVSNILWRKEMKVDDDIMPNGELHAAVTAKDTDLSAAERKEGEDFLTQLQVGKSYLHGLDKKNRPINVVRVRLHKPGAQTQDSLERYIVHVFETTRILVTPPVETGTIIFDMKDFSLGNMDFPPVKFIIKCFEANYPESLGMLLIHNAPWIFSGIWKIIQPMLDPVVAQKVAFTRSFEDLEKYIPADQLPTEMGGSHPWEYSYPEPIPDENDAMKDTDTRDVIMLDRLKIGLRLMAATAGWIDATTFSKGKENWDAVAKLKERREAIMEELRLNYWKLDPYVRARAYVDRNGSLKPDGTVVAFQ